MGGQVSFASASSWSFSCDLQAISLSTQLCQILDEGMLAANAEMSGGCHPTAPALCRSMFWGMMSQGKLGVAVAAGIVRKLKE